MAGPLADVTVLDLTEGIAGPYATKLLADYGADVIKVERPGGDGTRRVGPYKDHDPHPEKSGTFFYFNTNKRSLVLDWKAPGAAEVIGRLVDRADIVVEAHRPGTLDRAGIGWAFIHARQPEIALVSISNFGQDGPYRDFQLADVVLYGFAGEMYSMGVMDREPVKTYGTASLVQCGTAASTAIMAALTVSETQGIGQHVDFALADAQFNGLDRRHATTIGNVFSGRMTLRMPGPASALLSGVYPCADGYVDFTSAANRLDRVLEMLGSPEWSQDPRWSQPGLRFMPDLVDEFNAHFLPWLLDRTRMEIWRAARDARVICGPLMTVEDLFSDAEFQRRGYWPTAAHAVMGEVTFPGRPMVLEATPWELRRPAPLLGEHTRAILRECGYDEAAIARLAADGAVGGVGGGGPGGSA